jgi:Putative metal-binding motif
MNPARSIYVSTIVVSLLLACSSSSNNIGLNDGGTRPSDSGAGGSSSVCTLSCDDGHECTVDTCVNTKCQHSIGPRTGATACPTGQYCTLDSGCVAAPACSTADQCIAAWKDDACKTNVKCEAASSVCTFDLLDKDGDGHAPQICGGDDCDDADATIKPGRVEACNGIDDDCDGLIDEDDADTPICGKLLACSNGKCTCKPEYVCGSSCADVSSDVGNCGSCGHSCGTSYGYESGKGVGYWSCVAGTCQCSTIACGSVCTDLNTDNQNCGACGVVCSDLDPNSWCLNGQCGRHCLWDNSITCASSEICKYDNLSSDCVPDPCPGQALSCDAPCNAGSNCATCTVGSSHNLWCR